MNEKHFHDHDHDPSFWERMWLPPESLRDLMARILPLAVLLACTFLIVSQMRDSAIRSELPAPDSEIARTSP